MMEKDRGRTLASRNVKVQGIRLSRHGVNFSFIPLKRKVERNINAEEYYRRKVLACVRAA